MNLDLPPEMIARTLNRYRHRGIDYWLPSSDGGVYTDREPDPKNTGPWIPAVDAKVIAAFYLLTNGRLLAEESK